jgi:hypothetical protein
MNEYPNVKRMLAVSFHSEDRISLDAAKSMYARFVQHHPQLDEYRNELVQALGDPAVSWRQMLQDANYNELDISTEDRARSFIIEVVLGPLASRS